MTASAGDFGGVTVETMLQHPSWSEVTVLAGPIDSGRTLEGGVVVDDLGEELPSDMRDRALVVMHAFDRTDWRLDATLARAYTAGAGAVIIAGHETPLRSTSMLSARLGLPLLGAARPLAAYVALLMLTSHTAALRAELVVRASTACQRAGALVEEVLAELHRALDRSVALLDRSGNQVAGPPLAWGEDLPDVRAGLEGQPTAQPVTVPLPSGGVVVAHSLSGIGLGSWLIAKLPANLPAEVGALPAALVVGAIAVQERLALRRLGIERDARYRVSLMEEVLRSADGLSPGLRRRALDMGWRLDGWHVAALFGVFDDVDITELRAEVTAALSGEGVESVVVERGKGWAVWTTMEAEPTATQVKELGSAIRRAQRRLAGAVGTFVGVGRGHPGPAGISRSLAEASDAARLAGGRPETGHFLHIDRLGLAQLLLAWTRTDTFQPAAKALLAPLQADSGDLLRTLSAYLDAESSTAETAAVLGVHRNTVTGRVARIQELLGVNMADPETRLALHLACRTANLKAAVVPREPE